SAAAPHGAGWAAPAEPCGVVRVPRPGDLVRAGGLLPRHAPVAAADRRGPGSRWGGGDRAAVPPDRGIRGGRAGPGDPGPAAAGLVVEEGGLLQHATRLAREFGIPAVVGVARATELFSDGEILEVSGDTGEVTRTG